MVYLGGALSLLLDIAGRVTVQCFSTLRAEKSGLPTQVSRRYKLELAAQSHLLRDPGRAYDLTCLAESEWLAYPET
jgi:hypothetical protein